MRDKLGRFIKGVHISPKTEFKKGENCGENHPRWKGGRRRLTSGYITILSPDHPFRSKSKYVMEHRLIMEECLGRFLNPDEAVHHINNVKDDNRIENLKLMSQKEHKKLHFKLPILKKGQSINTGRTHFKAGHIPWNKGKSKISD